jgi:hypothetical protein
MKLQLFRPSNLLLDPKAAVFSPDAPAIRDEIIERSKAIERVAGASSNEIALAQKKEIQDVLSGIEDMRKQTTAPFRAATDRVNQEVKNYVAPLEAEKNRLSKLLSDFAAEQDRLAREAQRKQEEELARLRAEHEEARLAAQLAIDKETQEKAQEALLNVEIKAAEVVTAPVVIPIKAEGQRTKPRWVTKVNDPAALYKVFPDLVGLTPKLREINAAVAKMVEDQPDMDPQLPGCVITKEYEVSSR